MRTLLAASLLILAVSASAQDWSPVSLGTGADLLAIENTSFSQSYVVGTGGFAAQSDFDREVWTPVNPGTTSDLNSVLQPAFWAVWLGAGGGTVRRLIADAWEPRNPPGGQDYHLFSRGSGTAGAVGRAGDIYTTVDGGDTWDHRGNQGVGLNAGKGFVTSQFWVVGDGGTILKTSNGGVNFDVLNSGTSADLHAFLEGVAYFAVGANGTILKSVDAGATWSPRYSGTAQTLRAISSSGQNSNWLMVVGDAGTVLKSTNAGESWCRLDADTSADLYAVRMVSNSEYIVGGAGGVMMRTTTGGGDCISTAADLPSLDGPSLALYPNPLRGAGSVQFAAPQAGAYSLAVFDVASRQVAAVSAGRLAAGESRSLELNTKGWTAGVYFLRISQGGIQVVRRFTVLR